MVEIIDEYVHRENIVEKLVEGHLGQSQETHALEAYVFFVETSDQ